MLEVSLQRDLHLLVPHTEDLSASNLSSHRGKQTLQGSPSREKTKGPLLPTMGASGSSRISRELGTGPLWASAILTRLHITWLPWVHAFHIIRMDLSRVAGTS